jgi:hypothetical protein
MNTHDLDRYITQHDDDGRHTAEETQELDTITAEALTALVGKRSAEAQRRAERLLRQMQEPIRDTYIHVRVTDAEKQQVREAAKAEGKSFTEFVRERVGL